MNRLAERLLEEPWLYRTWQAPFAEQKFAPVLAHNDLLQVRRVLDVGCGTGTNFKHFEHTEYLGIDINERYIEDARQRFKGQFEVADIRTYSPPPHIRFDFILINSFLHHLDSDNVKSVLGRIRKAVAEDGYVHILEPVMPQDASISSLLAHLDRGRFVRSQRAWELLFAEVFEPVVYESYPVTGAGVTLWNMLYFKGRPRK